MQGRPPRRRPNRFLDGPGRRASARVWRDFRRTLQVVGDDEAVARALAVSAWTVENWRHGRKGRMARHRVFRAAVSWLDCWCAGGDWRAPGGFDPRQSCYDQPWPELMGWFKRSWSWPCLAVRLESRWRGLQALAWEGRRPAAGLGELILCEYWRGVAGMRPPAGGWVPGPGVDGVMRPVAWGPPGPPPGWRD